MKRALKITISLAVLAYAFYSLDWAGLVDALQRVRVQAFIEALALSILCLLVLGVRWYRIVEPHVSAPLREHMRVYLYATFLNSFTPANVGGDVYRLVSLSARGKGVVGVALALVRERIIGVVGYLLAYVACFAALGFSDTDFSAAGDGVFAWSAGIAVLVLLGIALTPFVLRSLTRLGPIRRSSKVVAALEGLATAVTSQSFFDLCVLLGLSFIGLLLWVAAIGAIARDVGLDLPWLTLAAITILVEIVRMVPVSIQGIGVREGAFALLASFVGFSAESGFIVAGIGYLALTAALLSCGMISWLMSFDARTAHGNEKQPAHDGERAPPRELD